MREYLVKQLKLFPNEMRFFHELKYLLNCLQYKLIHLGMRSPKDKEHKHDDKTFLTSTKMTLGRKLLRFFLIFYLLFEKYDIYALTICQSNSSYLYILTIKEYIGFKWVDHFKFFKGQ